MEGRQCTTPHQTVARPDETEMQYAHAHHAPSERKPFSSISLHSMKAGFQLVHSSVTADNMHRRCIYSSMRPKTVFNPRRAGGSLPPWGPEKHVGGKIGAKLRVVSH